jgi:PAS domain S-box-containing protein
MRILLIDDSMAYREEFALVLADAKVKHSALDYATTVSEGARMLSAGLHDIYFIDFRLPGGDGLALVRDARSAGMTKPVIVLTAYDSPGVDRAAEEAGATDYLPKGGFTPQMLDRAIRYAVRNTEAVRTSREALSLFQMAQQAAGIGAWDWDIRASTFTWSPRQREIFGLTPDVKVVYDTWQSLLHPEDRDAVQAAVAAAVAGHKRFDTAYRIMRPDPTRPEAARQMRWIAAKGEVFRDASDVPLRMVGINVDITEQKNSLAELESSRNSASAGLQASEARFQAYFETSDECLFHVRRDSDGVFRYESINPSGLAHAGATLAMVRNRTPEEVLGPEAGGMMTTGLRSVCETGLPYRYEPTFNLPGGAVIFDAVYLPLRNASGEITGVLGCARDITERRRLEASLHQSQKMEALGQLAGGIAHDFNNLLTGILGCFELLGRQVTADSGKRFVSEGIRAVERSKALTGRLLAFSRQQQLATEPVDINAALEEITEMLSRTLGSDVRIGTNLAADAWLASTDRNQIELAILNLGINARDAMPLGGSLTLATRNETFAEARNDLAPGDYVAIAVTDSGSGMTPELLDRVMEPFFTTKGPGKGTGLGLSMVVGVVKQFGGSVEITSELGKGTCVTLFLPRAQAEDVAAPVPSVRRAGPVSILLVDDDTGTLSAITAYATEAGNTVRAARGGSQALAILEAGSAVDIMVIDSTLPGLPIGDLIARARALRAGLPVMLISGQSARSEMGDMPILAKPFGRDAFNAALAAVLRAVRPSGLVVPLRPDAARGG